MMRTSLFAFAFVAVASLAHAETAATKPPQEVNIEANEMQILDKEKKAIFKGNVDATRKDVHLACDQLVVYYGEEKNDDGTTKTVAQNLDATGHVTIVTKTQKITGEWAKLDVKTNKAVVGGNVQVVQGNTVLKGERLDVDLDTNLSQMTGGRVKGSFLPK